MVKAGDVGPISGRTQELKELRPYMLPEQLSPCTSATEAPSSGACLPQLERVHAPQGKTPHAATKTQHIQNKLKKKKKKASQRKCHLSGKEVSLVAREEVGVVESNPSRRESKCKGPEVDTHARGAWRNTREATVTNAECRGQSQMPKGAEFKRALLSSLEIREERRSQ